MATAEQGIPFRVECQYADGRARFDDAIQLATIFYVADALGIHFKLTQRRSDVYFAHDLPIRYEEGNPDALVVPDLFVKLGVSVSPRRSYNLWEEQEPPDFAFDVVTRSKDPRRDWEAKPALYAALGIGECWQFDPTGRCLEPRLRGFRLQAGSYLPLPPTVQGSEVTVRSLALGLDMQVNGSELRMRDPETGRVFPTVDEATVAMVEAQARMRAGKRARREAEAALAKAEADLRAEQQARREAEATARETDVALCEEQQACEEAKADLSAEQQARREAEAAAREADVNLRAQRQARREAEADLRAQRRARREAEADLRAQCEARRQTEARIPELEARLAALQFQTAPDTALSSVQTPQSAERGTP